MYKKSSSVVLVGVGTGKEELLTLEGERQIRSADACVGAERLLALCPADKPQFAAYRASEICQLIRSHPELQSWAVLLSGDVGFYSGAKALLWEMEQEGIRAECVPGVASVVYLAAKLGVSWEDAALRSLHGRSQNVVYAIHRHARTFLLTDGSSGGELCRLLEEYDLGHVICHVGSRLSYEDEVIRSIPAGDLVPEDLAGLSVVMMENPSPCGRASVHIPDEDFLRNAPGGERTVPMTRAEVRAVSMAKLALPADAVFYDIGAGTGSVSVEASLHGENVQVYAIEQREDACALLRENRRRFRVPQMEIIRGMAPEAMEGLPAPTHAFIGGSGGQMRDIICHLKQKNPEVVLVINAITLETLEEILGLVREGILKDPEILQLQVSKARQLGAYRAMTGQNPVYIITERKP